MRITLGLSFFWDKCCLIKFNKNDGTQFSNAAKKWTRPEKEELDEANNRS